MSLGFSSGIGQYAEEMGAWTERKVDWFWEAWKSLAGKEMWQRIIDLHNCLEWNSLIPITDGLRISTIAVAIANGYEFTFYDGDPANEFILYLLNKWSIDLEAPVCKLFTPFERMQLGLKN